MHAYSTERHHPQKFNGENYTEDCMCIYTQAILHIIATHHTRLITQELVSVATKYKIKWISASKDTELVQFLAKVMTCSLCPHLLLPQLEYPY